MSKDDLESSSSTTPSKDAELDVVVERPKKPAPNAFTQLYFTYLDPLIRYGYRKRLEEDDLYEVPTVNTKRLYDSFAPRWEQERTREKPDLKRVVMAGQWHRFLLTALLYLGSTGCSLVGPLMIRRIVDGLACYRVPNATCPHRQTLYYYMLGICLAPLFASLCENHQRFQLFIIGTAARNALMAAIFRKCLKLSASALQKESVGKVVTLMSNDSQKVQDVMYSIHNLWGAPIYVIVILALLYRNVGWAAFVGAAAMAILTAITSNMSKVFIKIRRQQLQFVDKRISLMAEVIAGMGMIKYYAWEGPFEAAVRGIRSNEGSLLRRLARYYAMFFALINAMPVLVAIACFATYSLAIGDLGVGQVYSALALFALLRMPLGFLPMQVTSWLNAMVSLRRICNFLLRDEAPPMEQGDAQPGEVKVEGGEFSWGDPEKDQATLRDVNFHAPPGSLTMVVGQVGSGKSSLLSALIGHMPRLKGTVAVGGSVAYTAQSSWIINESVRDNVLMGSVFEQDRYDEAVRVSQLGPDLAILPNGDHTEIGDRGITLSGGQKQRVAIARAVYAGGDVVLMDDPLSAVDAHVGRAIMDECIRGTLKGKTVVLATNALQYLQEADHIIWLDAGAVRAQGSYAQLVEAGLDVAALLHYMSVDQADAPSADGAPAAAVDVPKAGAAGEKDQKAEGGKQGGPLKAVAAVGAPGVAGKGSLAAAPSQGAGTLVAPMGGGLAAARSKRNLTGSEEREEGSVTGKMVARYVAAAGGVLLVLLQIFLYAGEQGVRAYTDTFVGLWATDSFHRSLGFYLAIYTGLGVGFVVVSFIRSINFMLAMVRASLRLSDQLLTTVMRLPKSFFDTNPAGRVLNRFSRDTEIMDATLVWSLSMVNNSLAGYLTTMVVISVATRWFAIIFLPITAVYVVIQRYYVPSARELQRIESITRSPVYSKFGEALAGVPTIRAFRKSAAFVDISDRLMQHNANAFLTQKMAATWLTMRLDLLGAVILTLASVLAIQGNISPALAGLALVYALDVTRYLQMGATQASRAETDLNSVERIVQYLELPLEAAPESTPEVLAQLPPGWPARGEITLSKVEMRYRPNTPLVLKGVSFTAEAGKKVGIVGRTGSGKSSLFVTIFRMVEPEAGRITIDGVDITTLGLRHLRGTLSIIPQEPFLFSGSVRRNLDPFESHADDELWRVVELAGLKPVVGALEGGLMAHVAEGGANFSQGQRQLFCLARALLKRSRVLMLDEATASVDVETDAALQRVIRSEFAASTVLTIAHRINTVMDSDRVVVMAAGVVEEDGGVQELLARPQGSFRSLVEQASSQLDGRLDD